MGVCVHASGLYNSESDEGFLRTESLVYLCLYLIQSWGLAAVRYGLTVIKAGSEVQVLIQNTFQSGTEISLTCRSIPEVLFCFFGDIVAPYDDCTILAFYRYTAV